MNINPKKERNLIHDAEDADSVPVAKESNLTSLLEYHEQEPNDSFEQANYYFIGDAVIGTLGEEKHGMWGKLRCI
ncbi:hypothetical protein ACTP13_17885 [Paenibacillus peoriae]|uniref:hypothetical protein n=1 Tax=Paenibacillus peoriae TaxID=59893 RepID=UPI003F9B8965